MLCSAVEEDTDVVFRVVLSYGSRGDRHQLRIRFELGRVVVRLSASAGRSAMRMGLTLQAYSFMMFAVAGRAVPFLAS